MKLKVGQRYRTRDGRTAVVLERDNAPWPFRVQVEGSGVVRTCTEDGFIYSRQNPSPHDLVKELTVTPVVGRKFRTRNGRVAHIYGRDNHLTHPFDGRLDNGHSVSYTIDGTEWTNKESGHDLIEMLTEETKAPMNEPDKHIKPIVGHRYRTKNGEIVTITDHTGGIHYKYRGEFEGGHLETFTEYGEVWVGQSDHPRNLAEDLGAKEESPKATKSIQLDKKYRTRGGNSVFLYSLLGQSPKVVVGAIETDSGLIPAAWTADGFFDEEPVHDCRDLVEVPERPRDHVATCLHDDDDTLTVSVDPDLEISLATEDNTVFLNTERARGLVSALNRCIDYIESEKEAFE